MVGNCPGATWLWFLFENAFRTGRMPSAFYFVGLAAETGLPGFVLLKAPLCYFPILDQNIDGHVQLYVEPL